MNYSSQNEFDDVKDGTVISSVCGSVLTQQKTHVNQVDRGDVLSRWKKQKMVLNAPENIAKGPIEHYI